jgi:methionine biosynthesis protein MetW
MLRIGQRCVVSFPNFVYWKPILQMLLTGRTPVTENLPFRWYNTPNLHYLTIRDFRDYCRKQGIRILQCIALREGRRHPLRFLPSLRGEEVIYVISDQA